MRGPGGRGALVAAGLLALLFGVVAGFELTVHAEFDERHDEKPKFDSPVELATNEKLQAANGEFDFLTLSQRWPGTYCQQSGSCCDTYEQPAKFTVNGLWPDNDDGSYPKCCGGPAFHQSELDDVLLGALEEHWPRVSCSSPTACNGKVTELLWESEWDKHGICAYPTIPSVWQYFSTAVLLADTFPMLEILKNAGFDPDSSEEYATTKVIAAVQAALGVSPKVTCIGNQIYEIQFCLTKGAQLRDCLDSGSCPPTLVIPPFESDDSNSPRFSVAALRRK